MDENIIPAEKTNLLSPGNFTKNLTQVLDRLEDNWEQFVNRGTQNNIIRNEILRSWLRCRDSYIDPYKGYANKIMPYDQLRERYNDAMELVNVSLPFMQSLYNSVRGCGYIVMLVDKDGVILELFGDMDMRRCAESLDTGQGATCDESIIGTTAPGICLQEKIPVRVFYKEHFCSSLHHWACSAAPIFDPQGRLLGSLDLSSLYENYHPYTLGMVIATAKAIEQELGFRAIHNKLKKTYHYIDTIINSIPEGMLLFNEKGDINHINAACAGLLGVSLDECHGASISKIIKNAEALTGLVARERQVSDRKLSLTTTGKGIIEVNANCKVVKDDDEDTITYMFTFNQTGKAPKKLNRNDHSARYTFADLIFASSKMKDIINYAQKVSSIDTTVLIEGESGTGKELFAQAIHNYSCRSKKPFMVVNCAALPKDLIHSELFGYEEGSFTGASKGGKPGKFELANGGTVFLDEIGDMPLEVQANMLRVLQEKQFMRIGGNQNIDLDIRIIAATNKHLASEVEKGAFRLDLFYRLNTVPIKIPALRERPEDILVLARCFLEKQCLNMGRGQAFISGEAERILLSYHWPGNVRELENVIVRIVNILEGDTIKSGHFPPELKAGNSFRPFPSATLDELVEDLERKTIVYTLNRYGKNISRAAQVLGITRATLYKKIRKYNIN